MRRFALAIAIVFLVAGNANAQKGGAKPDFIRENAPVIALTHVELIDGTGAAALNDQTIVIDHGKIAAVGATCERAGSFRRESDRWNGKNRGPRARGNARAFIFSFPGRRTPHCSRAVLFFCAAVSSERRNDCAHDGVDGSLRRSEREGASGQRKNGGAEFLFDEPVSGRRARVDRAAARGEGCGRSTRVCALLAFGRIYFRESIHGRVTG